LTENTSSNIVAQGTSYSSDVAYFLDTVYYDDLSESQKITVPIELTCSVSGGTSIDYNITPNGADPIPNWVSLNETTQQLQMITPEVTSNQNSSFVISSIFNSKSFPK
jgi:hypothetical protein